LPLVGSVPPDIPGTGTGDYLPPPFLFNGHLETVFPALFRRVSSVDYQRERIDTTDGDFLDLDWLRKGSRSVVIIQHGLEGNSWRPYVKGMARTFFSNGYDVLAWNYRGCSQEMNRLVRFYHSGATDDLGVVVAHAAPKYDNIFLVGFSLGGNLTLKYLGEPGINARVRRATVFSVPLHLESSCRKISTRSNWVYARRFVKSLKKKIADKEKLMPGTFDLRRLAEASTLLEFDSAFTAPIHGFQSAHNYYERCSAIKFLSSIRTPVLIVNTLNDPFLSPECFPVDACRDHPYIYFQVLARGGHVGFAQFNKNGVYWSEQRALHFIADNAAATA
jgi:predicted alpha/beta-fold hydrolase